MLAAHPPRRTSRSSTRNETDSLSSWSTTRESENLPGKLIRWSVAMEPAISRDTTRNTTQRYPWEYPSVAVNVEDMSHASDDFASVQQMRADCVATGRNLRLERA